MQALFITVSYLLFSNIQDTINKLGKSNSKYCVYKSVE